MVNLRGRHLSSYYCLWKLPHQANESHGIFNMHQSRSTWRNFSSIMAPAHDMPIMNSLLAPRSVPSGQGRLP
ncbi:hypothetical protein TNCV_2575841 [Trichonephila clavipes]|uniref:Uncharacterized protein n=1 Tax=Trichonephila clavipes TaxID=2585209 RepID=A0A8X6UYM4_TRICX|nr:hypothetical protein TNCV_2575841 [Trichonephila clavipes]